MIQDMLRVRELFLVPTFLGPIKDFIIKIKYVKPDDQ